MTVLSSGRVPAGEGPEANRTFLRAAELAGSADLPELLGRAAVGYGGRFLWAREAGDDQLVPLLEDALAALGPADSALRVRVLSRLGATLRGEPSRARRERLCEEALGAARRLVDPATLAYALDAAEAALIGPHNPERRLAEAGDRLPRPEGGRSRAPLQRSRARLLGRLGARTTAPPGGELASLTRVAEDLRQPADSMPSVGAWTRRTPPDAS